MDSYNQSSLIEDISHNENFIFIENKLVNISILKFGNELDLFMFYSYTDRKGYARCSLYYMLKWIIDNLPEYNENTLIGINTIVPSKPRRTMET